MSTILIVDDQIACRLILAELLRRQGYCVIEAIDGQEALALARLVRLDLVISDIQMPFMDGYELVRHMRAFSALARIPVVFCTASPTRDVYEQARAAGVDALIAKPFLLGDALATVRAALERARDRIFPIPNHVAVRLEHTGNFL